MSKKIAFLIVIAITGLLFVDVSGNKFRKRVSQDEQRVRAAAKHEHKSVEFKNLRDLPKPVQRYFMYTLRNGQKRPAFVMLKQEGVFRMDETDNWVPFNAVQHMSASKPSFVWHGRLQPLPYIWTEARDLLFEGTGDTINRLFAAFPLSFAAGKETDVSALVQYLAEAPWIPTVLLPGGDIEWQAIDARRARAVLHGYGYRVSAVFTFSAAGEIITVTTEDRYRNVRGKKERQPWAAHYRGYQEVEGMKIPTEIETDWMIDGRTFSYARFKVTDIRYSLP